jgi:hypothetical protein
LVVKRGNSLQNIFTVDTATQFKLCHVVVVPEHDPQYQKSLALPVMGHPLLFVKAFFVSSTLTLGSKPLSSCSIHGKI